MIADQPSPRDVVTEACEETLNAYSAKPSLVRSDGNGEEKERGGYAKRPVL